MAWKHLRKLLLVNIVCLLQHLRMQVKAMQSEGHISETSRNAANFSVPKLIRDGLIERGKVCCGLTSPHVLEMFSEIIDIDIVTSRLKRKVVEMFYIGV